MAVRSFFFEHFCFERSCCRGVASKRGVGSEGASEHIEHASKHSEHIEHVLRSDMQVRTIQDVADEFP